MNRRRAWALIAGCVVVGLVATGAAYSAYKTVKRNEAECAEMARLDEALQAPIGTGIPLTVVGDSYSQGWGLDDPRVSWVSELDGYSVTVRAASSAGFTRGGLCDLPAIPDLTANALGTVIIQAGINDVDASPDDLARAAFESLGPHSADTVTVIGPAAAPTLDAGKLSAVDTTLARVAAAKGAQYVSALGWADLTFAADGLHLDADGHAAYGRHVEEALAR